MPLVWLVVIGALGVFLGAALCLFVQRYILPKIWPEDTGKPLPHIDVTEEPLIQSNEPLHVDLPQLLLDQLNSDNQLSTSTSAEPHEAQGTNAETSKPLSGQAANIPETLTDETLLAVNLLAQFFFREVQHHGLVRRFLLKRINKEMNEGLEKGGSTVNKIIKELKIFDIEMGSKAPALTRVEVERVDLDEENKLIDSVEVALHLEYSGGFAIGIDVTMAYEKAAQMTAKINRLEGILHVKFFRRPYSHFIVAFCPPPRMEVVISSRIQGQSYGTLTELLASLIENWITRQHCLPNAIMLTHPIFPHPDRDLLKPIPVPTSVLVRPGSLKVTIGRISRLDPVVLNADGLFCILALDSCPWVDFSPSESVGHVTLDIRMIRKRDRSLGFVLHGPSPEEANYSLLDNIVGDLVGSHPNGVVIINTEPGSAADEAGFRSGDVILEVDGTPVNSVRQLLQAIKSATAQYVIVRVDRFIPAIKSKVEETTKTKMPIIHPDKDPRSLYPLPDDLLSAHRETIARMVGLQIKHTETYPFGKVVELGETLEFRIKPGQRFLNLSVWLTGVKGDELEATPSAGVAAVTNRTPKFSLSRLFRFKMNKGQQDAATKEGQKADEDDETWMKEARLGYINVSLAEIAADCQLNTQRRHVSTYHLYPADLKGSLGRKNSLSEQPGFDPRLCYGDILLSFLYEPDQVEDLSTTEATSPTPEMIERHRLPIDVVIYELKRPHDWFSARFNRLVVCDSCRSKIWLGDGLQCRRCGLIIHKKCFRRGPSAERKWCSVNQSVAKIDDFFISNVPETPFPTIQSDLVDNPFVMDEENDEDMEIDAAVERLQGRDHNESLIRLAKDSSRAAFCSLDQEKRQMKILSMVNKLEEAVRAETIRRYELATEWEKNAGYSNGKWVELELAASERRRQALILLMLYLSVALQDINGCEHQGSDSS